MFSEKYRLQILDGSLIDGKTYMSGNYRGFLMTLALGNGCYIANINAHSSNPEGLGGMNNFLYELQQSNKNS